MQADATRVATLRRREVLSSLTLAAVWAVGAAPGEYLFRQSPLRLANPRERPGVRRPRKACPVRLFTPMHSHLSSGVAVCSAGGRVGVY